MKILRYIMLLAGLMSLSLQTIYAQRITRSFRNTSMSEALTILAKSTKDYRINFMYDELEDFTVTTSIVKRTAPDAIRQIMGFYPMKMTIDGENIFVECTQKTPTKMIGRIVDAHHRPVDFANVALLNVRDSSLINGGVTNENGQFVIPCGATKAIVRVSCVGYITTSNTYNIGKIGTIVLHENTINLKGVKVKAMRQNIKLGKEGMLVDIEHSELNKIGTATDVLREMPRVDVSSDGTVNVFAKGSPLIYINNRQVNDLKELHQLKSDNIKNVEIVTAPDAKYNAEIKSVIRIRTIRRQGEGWSGENYTTTKFNKWWGGSQYLSSTYRTGKAEVFGELWGTTTPGGEDNVLSTEINGTKNIFIEQTSPIKYRSKGTGAKVAFAYSIDDDNTFGLSYENQYGSGQGGTTDSYQKIMEDGVQTAFVNEATNISDCFSPVHNANAYYVGKIGKLGVDFNATYFWKKKGRTMSIKESSADIESRDVHTRNRQHSDMAAAKLILSYPAWKGALSVGSEFISSRIRGEYANAEQYVDASNTKINEQSIAGFAEYGLKFGAFSANAGVRYEYVKSDYYYFGGLQTEPSRRYSDWFPSASMSWNSGKWALQLAYTCKTRRPSYNSLRDEVQYDNRYTYEGGNPYLRPCITNNVDLNVAYDWLSLNAGYNYIDKPMVWVATLYQGKDIVFLRNVNFNNSQDVYVSIVASPRFGWYNPMAEIDYTQSFLCTDGFDVNKLSNRPCFNFRLNNRFNITPTLKAFLNMRYKTGRLNDLQKTKSFARVDMKFTKSFLNDALVIGVYANDLFKTDTEQWTMYGSHTVMEKDCYGYERCVGMSLSYNFNATKSKYKGTGAGNAEKSRL